MNATASVLSPEPGIPSGWIRIRDIPEPKSPPFIISDILHEATNVMFGRPEAGKSWLSLTMAYSLVTGEPWLGHEVRERRTVAFWQLDPKQGNETKRRIADADLAPLSAMPFTSKQPPRTEDGWNAEARELARNGVDFLIVDNLSRLMPRGQTTRHDEFVLPVLADLDAFGRCDISVLLLHHAGKHGEDGAPKSSPMGATCIEAWARHCLRVDAKQVQGREWDRSLLCFGNDYTGPDRPVPFAISDGVTAAEAKPGRREQEPRNRDQEAADARKAIIVSGQPYRNQGEIGAAIGTAEGTRPLSQSQVSKELRKQGLKLHENRIVDVQTGLVLAA